MDIPVGGIMPEAGKPPIWTVPRVRVTLPSITPSSLVPAASRSIVAVVFVAGATTRSRFADPTSVATCVCGTSTVTVPPCRTCDPAHGSRSVSRVPVVGHAYVSAPEASTLVERPSRSPMGTVARRPISPQQSPFSRDSVWETTDVVAPPSLAAASVST